MIFFPYYSPSVESSIVLKLFITKSTIFSCKKANKELQILLSKEKNDMVFFRKNIYFYTMFNP